MIELHLDARRGYDLLEQRLQSGTPDRDVIACHILDYVIHRV